MGVQLMDWEGMQLPEHLWLASLISDRSVVDAAALYNATCDLLDPYFRPDEHEVFVGMLSDFGKIPEADRQEVISLLAQDDSAALAISTRFRSALSLYHIGPASWLANGDAEGALDDVRSWIALLRVGQMGKAAQCRILGFNRLCKHDRIRFSKDVVDDNTASAISRYPNTSADETQRVEQLIRNAMNMDFQWRSRSGWAVAFWRRNFELVSCQ
jgi:hypothetical protein